jgi:hypothetical protein
LSLQTGVFLTHCLVVSLQLVKTPFESSHSLANRFLSMHRARTCNNSSGKDGKQRHGRAGLPAPLAALGTGAAILLAVKPARLASLGHRFTPKGGSLATSFS